MSFTLSFVRSIQSVIHSLPHLLSEGISKSGAEGGLVSDEGQDVRCDCIFLSRSIAARAAVIAHKIMTPKHLDTKGRQG